MYLYAHSECRPLHFDVHWTYTKAGGDPVDTQSRRRDRRLDLRTTAAERELIDRAVAAAGTGLTEFVITHATDAARRVLADRETFHLDPAAQREWDDINARPARDLPALRQLMQRPTPFTV